MGTRIGAVLSAPMVSLSMGLAAAAGGLLPPSCAVYDAVWEYLMPMAAGLFMLEHDVSRYGAFHGSCADKCCISNLDNFCLLQEDFRLCN
jgi:hypothetical protein